ncbi:solute carrier organic anion transporter family member 1B2-like [Oncorhynchus keta]|uniref:solute carrier organic anion transporter family member 1B2-like n=1 Tax=Oncorhynchus keta TaxID=8018 RepID=UPI00227CF092|nr:solute carrier organic anion transporter family member 1B2-like [Oncorhynchus keta]
MGNLLFLAVISHFGAKLHRPRLIAIVCFLMAVGSFLTGLPHFFMERAIRRATQSQRALVASSVMPDFCRCRELRERPWKQSKER